MLLYTKYDVQNLLFAYYAEQAASTAAMLLIYVLLVPALAMVLALAMPPSGQSTRSEAHQPAPKR